jgi:hypothetical protein
MLWDRSGPTYPSWVLASAVLGFGVTAGLFILDGNLPVSARGPVTVATVVVALLAWSFAGGFLVRPWAEWPMAALVALAADGGICVGLAVAGAMLPCDAGDCSNGYAVGVMLVAGATYIPIAGGVCAGKALARFATADRNHWNGEGIGSW